MLDNLRLTIKTTLIYSLGNMSTKLVGFILIPLYTTYLSTHEFGILGILEASSQIIIAFFGLGLYSAFNRWYWDKEYTDKKKSMFFTILCTVAVLSVLLVFISSRFSNSLSLMLFDKEEHSYLINLMLINTGFEALLIIPATLLRLQQKAVTYSITYGIKFLANLVFSIYFVKILNHNVEGIFEAQILGNLIYFIILLQFILKNIQFKFDLTLLKGMLKYSFPLIFSSVIGVLFTMTDRFVLKFLANLSDVGVYSLGYKIANTIKVFIVASINMAIWPIIFKMMDSPENKRFYSKLMTYVSFIVVFVVIGVSFFGKEIIKVLAQQTSYWDSYKVIPIISFTVLFGMLRDIALIGLHITKKTKIIATQIFFAFIINIILNIVFIPQFGIVGAAMGTCLAQFIMFLFIYLYAQKQYLIPYEIRKITLMIVLSFGLIALSFATNNLQLGFRLIFKTIILVSFPFILYFFNFYEKVELNSIKNIWLEWKNPLNWKKNLKRFKT